MDARSYTTAAWWKLAQQTPQCAMHDTAPTHGLHPLCLVLARCPPVPWRTALVAPWLPRWACCCGRPPACSSGDEPCT